MKLTLTSWVQVATVLSFIIPSVRGECYFERFAGYIILGLNDKTYSPATVAECYSYCLQQRDPPCRSFDYVGMTSSCFLSTETRETAPEFYGPHPMSDYYELVGDNCVDLGCRRFRSGREYRGQLSRTHSDRECQRWDSQTPHAHNQKEENMLGASFAANENYCRNPDGEPGGPWCYTTDPATRWEYCPVPMCTPSEEENLTTVEPTPTHTASLNPTTAQEVSCPADWLAFSGNCYSFYSTSFRDWFDASAVCWHDGGFLVTIETREEFNFLASILHSDSIEYKGQWWIGAFRGNDDQWYWVGDNNVTEEQDLVVETSLPMSFTAWHKGEPNNWSNVEDKATMLFKNYKWLWNDDDGDNNRPFICESQAHRVLAGCERQPCYNGATCVTEDPGNGDVIAGITEDGPYCICAAGFTGIRCEINENITWVTFDGHSYLFVHDFASTYDGAQRHCEMHAANLVSINSQEEETFLESQMDVIAVSSPAVTHWWTGAKQDRGETRRKWIWPDGSTMTFTNWAHGEPSSWRKEKSVEITLHGNIWLWNDISSDTGHYFICELPFVSSDE